MTVKELREILDDFPDDMEIVWNSMVQTFYRCNPELNKECNKAACQKVCILTTHKEYAKTDEFGNPEIDSIIIRRWKK